MTYSEDQIRDLVRRILLRTLGSGGLTESPPAQSGAPERPARLTITEAAVMAVPHGGQLHLPAGAMITPLARDTALDRRVEFIQEPDATSNPVASAAGTSGQTVAVGADHGGYGMKEEIKAYLEKIGYTVIDCGTKNTDSVDYPDFAYAVAKLVSDGRAWRGILVDGAGIGSCIAANKVPGVRAAMCYDHATAVNSREHNDANVLTLGGVLIGTGLAQQIVKTWLETEFGGGRHARRVNKIMEIEKRFLRK